MLVVLGRGRWRERGQFRRRVIRSELREADEQPAARWM